MTYKAQNSSFIGCNDQCKPLVSTATLKVDLESLGRGTGHTPGTHLKASADTPGAVESWWLSVDPQILNAARTSHTHVTGCRTWCFMSRQIPSHKAASEGHTKSGWSSLHRCSYHTGECFVKAAGLTTCCDKNCKAGMVFTGTLCGILTVISSRTSAILSNTSSSTATLGFATHTIFADPSHPICWTTESFLLSNWHNAMCWYCGNFGCRYKSLNAARPASMGFVLAKPSRLKSHTLSFFSSSLADSTDKCTSKFSNAALARHTCFLNVDPPTLHSLSHSRHFSVCLGLHCLYFLICLL